MSEADSDERACLRKSLTGFWFDFQEATFPKDGEWGIAEEHLDALAPAIKFLCALVGHDWHLDQCCWLDHCYCICCGCPTTSAQESDTTLTVKQLNALVDRINRLEQEQS